MNKKFKNHHLCEAILTWADDYPFINVSKVGDLYEIICSNKPLRTSQRQYLIDFSNKYRIDVSSYL